MSRSLICALLGTALILTPGIAFAAHGRAGLWTVTSQMEMQGMPQMPPEAMAMMKARGMAMPGSPMTTQMCMTQEQVNADKPPAFSNREESCDTKVLSQSPSAMSAQMTWVCMAVGDWLNTLVSQLSPRSLKAGGLSAFTCSSVMHI